MSRRSLELADLREELYRRQQGRCAFCGDSLLYNTCELAHRISNSEWAKSRWGVQVVDHHLNKVLTHAGFCNDGMLMDGNPKECEAHVARIREAIATGKW